MIEKNDFVHWGRAYGVFTEAGGGRRENGKQVREGS